MARGPKGPIEVSSYGHDERRANIPTADAAVDFFDDEAATLPPVAFERVITDPELVWRGKSNATLSVDAPPIYIQEKIVPRALIENLRKTAKAGEAEPEVQMFEMFDELDDLSQVEFYQHEESWKNRMILGDSLQVMGSLAEREALRGKVQMVYIDPPYGISFGSNWQPTVRNRNVKDGNLDYAAREAEQIKAFRDTWELGIHSYLSYLRDRLVVARDLLASSGSIFVQIGDENVHLVRNLMDEVFGSENFCGQFSFRTKIPLRTTLVPAVYDHIIWFAKSKPQVKFRRLFKIRRTGDGTQFTKVEEAGGVRRPLSKQELKADPESINGRLYRLTDLVSAGRTESCVFEFELDGKKFFPNGGKSWKTNREGMKKLILARRIEAPAKTPNYVFFADDYPVEELTNVWNDTQGASDRTYVVQTATKVIERCLLMTTDPGDLVLDPTCGSGTTAFVGEQWGRRWITIDTSRVALELARERIMASRFPYYTLADSDPGRRAEDLPPAATRSDVRQGFVYARVPHITLGSITNNPDIQEGRTREQLDAAIKRHADFELLYDQPLEDRSRVRVAGPFTVESLSPHRSVSFDEADSLRGGEDEFATGFEEMILANLRRAGIQNGRRAERVEFESLEQVPGEYVQAIGDRKSGDNAPSRIAIALGPQYGTVSPGFIKQAAKEAIGDSSVDLLCVLGFAFDPLATGVTEDDGVTVVEEFATVEGERKVGRIQVLLVRMNVDLLMGEDLKKTGAGNLFTVFGEPDLSVHGVNDGKLEVTLRGDDVYDPTSGEVRSKSTKEITLWMLDTDYDGESFFARHAYFSGSNDSFKSLKAALKADIDPDAWEALYRTTSLPFDRPSTGKIAVKIINDYGDEVMKVIDIG
jgi:adenine-specific DNA-methyltransferase